MTFSPNSPKTPTIAIGTLHGSRSRENSAAEGNSRTFAGSVRFRLGAGIPIGTGTPTGNLHVYGTTPSNQSTLVTQANYPSVTSNATNYIRNNLMESYTLPISSGVTDSGYRVGLDIENFTNDANFLGTLASQYGLWARVGSWPEAAPGP